MGWLLLGFLLVGALPAAAQSVFVPAGDAGVYDDAGDHAPGRHEHTAGAYPPFWERRSFLTFDLSRVTGTVTGARLHIDFGGYFGDESETFTLYEIATPVSEVVAGGTGLVHVFDDLAEGLWLGSRDVGPYSHGVVQEVPLEPAAAPWLQAALGGEVAIGLSLSSLSDQSREQLSGCCLTLVRMLELEGDLEVTPVDPPGHFAGFHLIDFESASGLPGDLPGVTFVNTPKSDPDGWISGSSSWGGRIFGARHFGNLYSGDYSELAIDFDPPVGAVGGWIRNVPQFPDEGLSVEVLRVSAYGPSGQLLEERTVDLPAADAPPVFESFSAAGGIARIRWSSDGAGHFGVDDIVYGDPSAQAVPALSLPAQVVLALLLAGVGAGMRRAQTRAC